MITVIDGIKKLQRQLNLHDTTDNNTDSGKMKMVDVCFNEDKNNIPATWCSTGSIICHNGRINITSVEEFIYPANSKLKHCDSNACPSNGTLSTNSSVINHAKTACDGQQNCSITNNSNITLPTEGKMGGYIHIIYICVQEHTLSPPVGTTRTSLTATPNPTSSQSTTLESSSTAAVSSNTKAGTTPATSLKTNTDTYATATQHFTSSLFTTLTNFPSTSVSNKNSVTADSKRSNSMSISTSTNEKVSAKPLTDAQKVQSVPVAVGVVLAVMLVVAVIVSVILYRRGKFESLLAKMRRRDNRSNDNPSFCHLSSGTLPDDKMPTYYTDIHLGDIDKPIVQTYNTASINNTTNVPDPTYNHIKHPQNNNLKADAVYNHIGEIELNIPSLINTQTDTYSHSGQKCSGETDCERTVNPHCHAQQMEIFQTGKTAEGAYSGIDVCMASNDQAKCRKERSAGNEGLKSTDNEERYIYSIPIKQ